MKLNGTMETLVRWSQQRLAPRGLRRISWIKRNVVVLFLRNRERTDSTCPSWTALFVLGKRPLYQSPKKAKLHSISFEMHVICLKMQRFMHVSTLHRGQGAIWRLHLHLRVYIYICIHMRNPYVQHDTEQHGSTSDHVEVLGDPWVQLCGSAALWLCNPTGVLSMHKKTARQQTRVYIYIYRPSIDAGWTTSPEKMHVNWG